MLAKIMKLGNWKTRRKYLKNGSIDHQAHDIKSLDVLSNILVGYSRKMDKNLNYVLNYIRLILGLRNRCCKNELIDFKFNILISFQKYFCIY